MTRHTQKNNIEKTLPRPFFFVAVAFFFFFKVPHKTQAKNKTQLPTPGVQNQRSVVIIMVHQLLLLQKLLLKKTRDGEKKKNSRERKRKCQKDCQKTRRLGPRTSVIPHYYYPQDHTITRPHYHKRAWHNREHEERERPHVPLVRTKQKRCFDAEERKEGSKGRHKTRSGRSDGV